MAMNLEAMSQIADAVSFILVTPEFMGEKRLAWFRSIPVSGLWKTFLLYRRYTVPSAIAYFVYFALVIPGLWYHPEGMSVIAYNPGWLVFSVLFTLISIIVIVIAVLQLFAYRGLLFFLGAGLFLYTRYLGYMHAMYPFTD